MSRIAYENKKLIYSHLEVIAHANRIISDYKRQGYDLTLRQVYYQFVAHDLFPEDRRYIQVGKRWVKDLDDGTINAEPNYSWLGDILNKGRMCGLVDWNSIVDRTRKLYAPTHFDSPEHIINTMVDGYGIDLWADQDYRVEVWVEKEALAGVIGRAAGRWDLDYFTCKGYVSQSAQWRAAMRLIDHVENGQRPVIIHLGDHDPSGIDMTRDIYDRLALFMETHGHAAPIIERVALNMDQIRRYNPPPNPAKESDSRAAGYIEKFGDKAGSWTLWSPA